MIDSIFFWSASVITFSFGASWSASVGWSPPLLLPERLYPFSFCSSPSGSLKTSIPWFVFFAGGPLLASKISSSRSDELSCRTDDLMVLDSLAMFLIGLLGCRFQWTVGLFGSSQCLYVFSICVREWCHRSGLVRFLSHWSAMTACV